MSAQLEFGSTPQFDNNDDPEPLPSEHMRFEQPCPHVELLRWYASRDVVQVSTDEIDKFERGEGMSFDVGGDYAESYPLIPEDTRNMWAASITDELQEIAVESGVRTDLVYCNLRRTAPTIHIADWSPRVQSQALTVIDSENGTPKKVIRILTAPFDMVDEASIGMMTKVGVVELIKFFESNARPLSLERARELAEKRRQEQLEKLSRYIVPKTRTRPTIRKRFFRNV